MFIVGFFKSVFQFSSIFCSVLAQTVDEPKIYAFFQKKGGKNAVSAVHYRDNILLTGDQDHESTQVQTHSFENQR